MLQIPDKLLTSNIALHTLYITHTLAHTYQFPSSPSASTLDHICVRWWVNVLIFMSHSMMLINWSVREAHSVRMMFARNTRRRLALMCVNRLAECFDTTRSLFVRYCGQSSSLLWTPVLRPHISLAPTYLTTDIHLVSEYGRCPLCSPTDRTLTVPRTHNRFGDRSFAAAGPRLWNSLPISLRQICSFGQFRQYLKNHLFGTWEITAQCDAWFSALYIYSYLLTY